MNSPVNAVGAVVLTVMALPLYGEPNFSILLPERTRLLQDQRVDVVIEARNLTQMSGFRVTANNVEITNRFRGPIPADLDCDATPDAVFRADLFSFTEPGSVLLVATVNSSRGTSRDVRHVLIVPFSVGRQPRNIILLIGDAMGTSHRDAGRFIARSVETVPGVPGLREGFFDRLLEMDQMPVSGMVMNYSVDRIISDSSSTATAWAVGNKTVDRSLSALPDGTDCAWEKGLTLANMAAANDNPRVESLWEYLKRKHNYRTGVVSSSNVTDATPAAHGSHNGSRDASFEIARQYLENPFLGNQPVFDVLLGGGKEDFDPDIRADNRNLVYEFQAKGYTFMKTATELRGLEASAGKILGLFRRPDTVSRHSSGVRASSRGTMQPAYDKLGLIRPGSEPLASFGSWADQPFLDEMAQKAIEVLSGPRRDQPFVLMVEGALIDKQSHSGHAAGALWDVIELDKAVGVARAWARSRRPSDTLVIVTADHDQTLTIIGVTDISDRDLTDRIPTGTFTINPGVGEQKITVYKDVNTNVRAGVNYSTDSAGRTGPPAAVFGSISETDGFPDYMDADGDGYPENRQVGEKGQRRLVVGYRTGNHAGTSLPLTAEGVGAFLFTGYMDQTDLFFKMATVLTGETAEADALLESILGNPRYPRTYGK